MDVQTWPSVGWLDSPRRTNRPHSPAANTGLVIALAFMVGTGGVADVRYLQKRQERGYGLAAIRGTSESPAVARTAAEDLERVRSVLKPAMSTLADLFGVSRQAIYNWANGEQPTPQYARRLDDMARAADIIAAEALDNSAQALKRKIVDGKTLLDIVRAGESAQDAAFKLAMILRGEADQRKQLRAKLAGRMLPSMPVDAYGSPMLDEHG